ncbi:MAG: PIG-L family deacetylase [Pseudomonadales bacterium]|nr:PIG-L family deacetylase [Pseudomonadales bacterium]
MPAAPSDRSTLPGKGHTVLVIVPHADDAALFCGGTLRLMADRGARVVLLRVTDDRYDSAGLDEQATIAANTTELHAAARLLGISEIIELGWQTDRLGDASEVALRERFIYHVRRLRPYAVLSFDPYGAYHEDNQDHVKVAQAVDETYWTAQFDKHHPEHFREGLAPHGVYERWYFARRLTEVTTPVDISATLTVKVEAALAHSTMMRHYAHQLCLQARTGGHTLPLAEAAAAGALRPLLEPMIVAGARATGARHGLAAAEEFRVVRFGGLERWFGIGSDA